MGISSQATRRSVLAALPSLAAVVAPGAANAIGELSAEPDPIFAAIAAVKAARRNSNAAGEKEWKLFREIADNGSTAGFFEKDKFLAGHFKGQPLYASTEKRTYRRLGEAVHCAPL
jgi:hypothetical protein